MMPFGKVHGHYVSEGRSKKVNTEKKSGKEPPTPQSAQLIRKMLSASALRSKGLLEVKE